MASDAKEESVGNAVVVASDATESTATGMGIAGDVVKGLAAVCRDAVVRGEEEAPEGERRVEVAVEAAATASSSLRVRLSLTRSDKLLTTKWKVIVVSHCLRICILAALCVSYATSFDLATNNTYQLAAVATCAVVVI